MAKKIVWSVLSQNYSFYYKVYPTILHKAMDYKKIISFLSNGQGVYAFIKTPKKEQKERKGYSTAMEKSPAFPMEFILAFQVESEFNILGGNCKNSYFSLSGTIIEKYSICPVGIFFQKIKKVPDFFFPALFP